jgi:putative DNA primase/helicase
MQRAFASAANERFEVAVSKEIPKTILDGEGRTREMVSYAGTLNSRGLTPQEMFESMKIVNKRFVPPLTDEKLQSIVDSIFKYDSADPIGTARTKEKNTDLGNARRLVRLHGADLRYDLKRKIWIAWNGAKWVEDSEADAMRLAKEVPAAMSSEAQGLSDSVREARQKWAKKSESAAALSAMIKLAKSEREIAANVEDFDRQPHLLNCANGTLDLRTGKLREHRREDMITKIINIPYDPSATAPLFEKFLDRIFAGNRSLIDFMQRAFGYSLSGITSEQSLFLCHGSGANGKSTLIEIIATAAGEYSESVRTEALMKHKNVSAGAANEDLVQLIGARFVSAMETDTNQQLAEALLKQMTGQDRMKARKNYGHLVEFRPQFKLFVSCNDKPQISGTGENSIWRRIHLIPFTVTIPQSERDKCILDKLNAELPGILAWCVRGAVEYYREGLKVPAEVKAATEQYKAEEDTLSEFISDALEVREDLSMPVGELYGEFLIWCRIQNAPVEDRKTFNSMMKARGFEQARVHSGRIWRGQSRRRLALIPPARESEPETPNLR